MNARTACRIAIAAAAIPWCAACGGPPKQANSSDDFGTSDAPITPAKPSADLSPPSGDAAAPAAPAAPAMPGAEGLNATQAAQIKLVLDRGARKAVQCPEVVPDSPSGDAVVKVTFDGKKGQSVDASAAPPFAGTPIEACIKRAYIGEDIVPFDGPPREISTTVKIAGKAAAPEPKKK